MSGIKKLAGQTMWYGLSTIAAKFINYILTPYITFKFTNAQYGEMSIIYSFIPFMNIIFTYGMETAYFRYANTYDAKKIYNTISISIIISSIIFSVIMLLMAKPLTTLLTIEADNNYLVLAVCIIFLDALSTLPFAKLRQENRPLKFAFIRITSILINVFCIYFFLSLCPNWLKENPTHWCSKFYQPNFAVGYILIANIVQSLFTLLLLSKEFFSFSLNFDTKLWKEMMLYSLPLIIAGFGGMINETFDRIMLSWWAPVQTEMAAKSEVGIYAACYKLSILITLSVQAFRMGAEPFFFKKSKDADAKKTYARVMNFFVITVCFMFLLVALYLDIWKHFIQNANMWQGLHIVPILLLANIFLGIYYNLSIWYKLVNKTNVGALITIFGVVITLVINYFFIPYYSYTACAWATFACYGSMMVLSYLWGQKEYPVPYEWVKLCSYIFVAVALYFIHTILIKHFTTFWFSVTIASLLVLLFSFIVFIKEKSELKNLPIFNKLIK
ncbi:MAG TPA: oligosaccharide flippase family protein [Chitinophagaceae bacterium]|nr:oligosaccharide flippase family protein [Chitinophagaceae bacterium]HNN31582.1 oligosaccharide flippase family protein [Chitinophagaceae bacterium]